MSDTTSNDSLMERLADPNGRLRPSEQKVADTVLADPGAAVRSSMAHLTAKAGVSEPTVMRFSAALGFDGFQSFKLALAEALAIGIPLTYANSAIGAHDPVDTMAIKIFDHTVSGLDRARRALDTHAVTEAVNVLLSANSVLFIGLGASGIVAQDALQKAELFGVPCAAPIDHHQQFMAASMLSRGDVVVAISNTGRTRTILKIAEHAKAKGATLIAIVGGPSPLMDLADVPLILPTFEDTDMHTPTVSRLAGLVLVDVLATAIAIRRGPAHLERLREMKEDLASFRGSVEPESDTPADPGEATDAGA